MLGEKTFLYVEKKKKKFLKKEKSHFQPNTLYTHLIIALLKTGKYKHSSSFIFFLDILEPPIFQNLFLIRDNQSRAESLLCSSINPNITSFKHDMCN